MTGRIVPSDNPDDAAASVIKRLLADLSRDVTDEAHRICDVLEREISELRGNPQLLELLSASVESNVSTFLKVVREDVPASRLQAPAPAVDYAHHLARTGAPATALIRAYRLGYNTFIDRIYERMAIPQIDPAVRLPVFHRIGQIGSTYIDWISESVVRAYQDERERWLSHRDAFRANHIRKILTGPDDIDPGTASAGLDYRLDRTHRALIAWTGDSGGGAAHHLNHEVRAYAMYAAATAPPLIVPVDERTVWAWFPVNTDSIRPHENAYPMERQDIHLAVGAPHAGLAGFRLSHREATDARRIATLAAGGAVGGRVVDYTMPGIAVVAQITHDIHRVDGWVASVLGELAPPTEQASRLRTTLREFLLHNASHKAAAAALHLHPNTIKYRIASAERALGKPLATHRLDIEVALLISRWRMIE